MNIDFGGGFLIFLVATLWILVAHFWWLKFGGETNFFGGGMYLISSKLAKIQKSMSPAGQGEPINRSSPKLVVIECFGCQ